VLFRSARFFATGEENGLTFCVVYAAEAGGDFAGPTTGKNKNPRIIYLDF